MTDILTPARAAEELLYRQNARSNILDFTTYTFPNYQPSRFHKFIASELDNVASGEVDRLILMAPPRHGKTEISSARFPAFFLGKNPHLEVIASSYNLERAKDNGRKTRNIIQSDEFRRLFPHVGVADDSSAAERFALTTGGSYRAAGPQTAVTGRGAHVFLIDDPVKDRVEADSPTTRERIWEWYQEVVYTRLETGGRIVLIMTRWHVDDLAGRLIQAMDSGGDQWRIVRIPAICESLEDPLGREPGEALWPERYPVSELRRKQDAVGARAWAALYQQRPVHAEGGVFKGEWFKMIEQHQLPQRRVRVRAWDLAGTSAIKGDPDYTVGVLMSKDPEGRYYIENVKRMRGTPLEVEQLVFRTAENDGRSVKIRLPQDPGQAGKSQVESFIRRLPGFDARAVRPTGSKEVRAVPFAAQAEAGNVYMVNGSWVGPFKEELSVFPNGTHDDQVDAAADAFNALISSARPMIRDW